jgi:hypothetical protein
MGIPECKKDEAAWQGGPFAQIAIRAFIAITVEAMRRAIATTNNALSFAIRTPGSRAPIRGSTLVEVW